MVAFFVFQTYCLNALSLNLRLLIDYNYPILFNDQH